MVYEDLFSLYKNKTIKLLEIGTDGGGDLILWNYYFPNGSIYGVDNVDRTNGSLSGYKRIKTYIEDAYTQEFVNKLPMLDLVIDDGPHTIESHIMVIKLCLPIMKPGGSILVIEDIPDINWMPYLSQEAGGFISKAIDTRKSTGESDNILFMVWK